MDAINLDGKKVSMIVTHVNPKNPFDIIKGEKIEGVISGYIQHGEKVSFKREDPTQPDLDVTPVVTRLGYGQDMLLERIYTDYATYSITVIED